MTNIRINFDKLIDKLIFKKKFSELINKPVHNKIINPKFCLQSNSQQNFVWGSSRFLNSRLLSMETETVYVISDESDAEDSSSTRRKADEQDPLEGKRILRKKKPKVSANFFARIFTGITQILISVLG